jgi:methyl-accepting chemotaxis protein
MLLGIPAGQITKIDPMPVRGRGSEHNVKIQFQIMEQYIKYLWTEGSEARLTSSGLLGKRQVEVTRGTNGYNAYVLIQVERVPLNEVKSLPHPSSWRLGEELRDGTNLLFKAWTSNLTEVAQKARELGQTHLWLMDTNAQKKSIASVWNRLENHYEEFQETNLFELPPYEEPALNDRLQAMVAQVQAALPSFLALTNQLSTVLANSAQLTERLSDVAGDARPAVSNLAVITEQLKNPKGSLGEWVIPTNINAQLGNTLQSANSTLTNANAALTTLAEQIDRSLENLAGITSNLNHQVEVNSNIVSQVSDIIVHSDQFLQGLKRHWLLRSAFRTPKTNAPLARPARPARAQEHLRSPKDQGE